ncbi:MAG: TonB-dependent receptor [Proteobacteria bacterium]|nr:TonB-dependent receptor [Pseudomonadota bacterium]
MTLAVYRAPAQEPASEVGPLEEVVVTARRTVENLQTTPVAVTALTGEAMQDRGVANLVEIGNFAPNVDMSSANNTSGSNLNSQIYIRGIGQQDFLITVDPGVGLYVDGVYFARSTGSVLDLLDVERVEILRGPQGSLFGKNTLGGAINVVSKPPADAMGGQVQATTGRFNRADIQASIDLPISDKVLTRFSVLRNSRDGFVKRINAGDDLADVNSLAGRAQVLLRPNDAFKFDLSVDGTRKREHSAATVLVAVSPVYARNLDTAQTFVPNGPDDPRLRLDSGGLAPIQTNGYALFAGLFPGRTYAIANIDTPFVNSGTGPNISDLDNSGVAGTATFDFDGMTLKSITAYRSMRAEFGRDCDNSPGDICHTHNKVDQHQFSQELQLSGKSFQDRLSWLAGLYFFHENASDRNDVRLLGGIYDALEQLPVLLGAAGPIGPCPPSPAGIPVPGPLGCRGNPNNVGLDFDLNTAIHVGTDSYAGFAQGSFAFTERLRATAGMRYTKESKDYSLLLLRRNSGVPALAAVDSQGNFLKPFQPQRPKVDIADWSPRAGIDFRATEDIFLYASVGKGFKSGGVNGRPTTAFGALPFAPETLWSYEIGAKTELFDRRMRLNLAAFYNDYRNIQLNVLREVNGVFAADIQNGGKARGTGFEAELLARVTSALTLEGSAGYLDQKLTSISAAAAGAGLRENSRLPRAPRWTFSGAATYAWPLGSVGSLTMRGDLTYRSGVWNDIVNTVELYQPGFALVNARVAWLSAAERFELAFFATNLTDKRYIAGGNGALDSLGIAEGVAGRPREWGVSARVRF